MKKFNMKRGISRLMSSLVIISLIVNSFYVGKIAQADTICTPTVTNSTSLGITNFTIGAINNTTPTPSGQGGVTYKDYTNSFSPVMVTKGSTVNYSLSFSPSPSYFGIFAWLDNSHFNAVAASGNPILNPMIGTITVPVTYPAGLMTLRVVTSSAMVANNADLCGTVEGEYEDYRLLAEGPIPAVNTLSTNNTTFVREGGRTDVIRVQLDKMPTANVTVSLTPSARTTLSSTTLTFTPSNWYVYQDVTVSAVDDALSNGTTNEQITFATSSADGAFNGLVVSPQEVQILDNEVTDDSSIEIHLFSTSTANNSGPDYSKVSGITSFGDFTSENFFGPTNSTDITVPVARRYNFSNSMTSVLASNIDPQLTTLTSPTVLALADDELTSDITLPFDVMMYGQAMKYIKISSNGIIYLAPGTIQATDFGNAQPYEGNAAMDLTLANKTTLTTTNELMIAALWSDLSPASSLSPGAAGTISYGVEGTAPNRVFIVYYDGVAPYDGTGGVNTVQVKFRESAINPGGEVNISANVDPSISYTLDTSNCSFGNLTSATVKTCAINVAVATNATSGYTAYIRDVNNGTLISGTDNINAVIGTSLNAGTEAFGVSTSVGSQNLVQEPDCSAAALPINVQPVTTSNQTFASAGQPVLGDDIVLCMAAGITDTTPAGSYSDTAIVTVVGNF